MFQLQKQFHVFAHNESRLQSYSHLNTWIVKTVISEKESGIVQKVKNLQAHCTMTFDAGELDKVSDIY